MGAILNFDTGRLRWLLLALALFAVVSCGRKPDAQREAVDAGPLIIGAENVLVLRREPIETGPKISGSLEARERAVIRAEAAGSVLELKVDVGQTVKRGQLLARIESKVLADAVTSAQSAVTSAQASFELATRQAERTERLAKAGAVATRDLEVDQTAVTSSQAQLDEARSRLASARDQLEAANVKSPLDGVVSEQPAHKGDVVSPGTHLFTIIDPSSMRLEAAVPSEHLSAIRVDAPVDFQIRGIPGQHFTGSIQRIAPEANPQTRQIPIVVTIPNPGGKLVAGLFAEGRIQSERKEGLVVPLSAIEQTGARVVVRRVRADRVQEVEVQLGVRDEPGERVEVQSGLEPGDRILIGAAQKTATGTPIRIDVPAPAASN